MMTHAELDDYLAENRDRVCRTKAEADGFERFTSRVKYLQAKDRGEKPIYFKAMRPAASHYRCGHCGRGHLEIEYDFCPNCGYRICWDSIRCLTGKE